MSTRDCAQHGRRLLLVLALGLVVQASSAAPAQGQVAPADSGFRPNPDGFSFKNYGSGHPDLTAAEMLRLFGGRVCVPGTSGAGCQLIDPAQAWMDRENAAMDGGHCFGLAATAQRMHAGMLAADPFGAPQPFALKIDGNDALAREIAYSFSLQALDSVVNGMVDASPQAVIDALRTSWASGKQIYALSIAKDGWTGGHAITPYAIQDGGDGSTRILVYDNNYPGDAGRYVTVDASGNWTYDGGHPGWDNMYTGDRQSQRLRLKPITPGLKRQPCSFCPKAGKHGAVTVSNQLDPAAKGERANDDPGFVMVTGPRGNRAGQQPDGDIVEKVAGADVRPIATGPGDDAPAVRVALDPGRPYRIDVTGRTKGARGGPRIVRAIGPGWVAAAGGLRSGPGATDTLRVSADGRRATLVPRRGKTIKPRVVLATERVRAVVRFGRVPDGSRLRVRLREHRVVVDGPSEARVTVRDARGRRLAREAVDGRGSVRFRASRG